MIPENEAHAGIIIHETICEESLEDCKEDWGRCQRAASALERQGLLK